MSGKHTKIRRNKRRDLPRKPGISLCMIVRDEEETLPRCINSVKPILSEIVVVDTGSSDGTVTVARSLGAKVLSRQWDDDFSAARNLSLRNASQKWILVLDADELVERADLPEIAALCRSSEFKAFEFVTRNYVSQSHWSNWVPNDGRLPEASHYPGWFPSRKVRLFMNAERVRYSGEIHELIEPSLKELGWWIEPAQIPVHHFAERSPERLLEKKDLYRKCAEKKVLRAPSDAKAFYEHGVHCSETDLYARAVEAFSEALKLAPDFSLRHPGLTNIHAHLSANLIKLSRYQEALSRIDEGLHDSPENCDLLHLRGISLIGLGQMKEAIASLERAVELNPRFSKGWETLGVAHHRAGDHEGAARSLRRALKLNPGMSEAARLLKSIPAASNGKRVRLSVCIIAKNEEENLPGCIESVKDVADEIVVVDTGSTDGTIDRAASLGARVFHFTWCDDFSAARNETIRHARGDYILWLDADDRVHADDLPKLKLLKENLPARKGDGFLFLLHNGKNGVDDDICYQLRLFPNLPGVAFQGRIHEQVVYSLEKLGVKLHQAEIRILHSGYAEKSGMEAKIRRNIELLLQEEELEPSRFITNFQLGQSYFFLGEMERAIERMERAAYGENNYRRTPFWHISAYVQLGWMYKIAGREQEALRTLGEALSRDPANPVAKLVVGEIKYYGGERREALEILSSISDEDFRPTVFALSIDKMRYHLHFLRGRCHEQLGDYPQAAAEYVAALAVDAGCIAAKKQLGALYLRQGKYREAEDILTAIDDAKDPDLLANLGLTYSRRGDVLRAEQMYEEALHLKPNLVEASVNLGHLLLKADRYAEARHHFEKAAQVNDSWADVHLGLSCAMVAEGDIGGCVNECSKLLSILGLPGGIVLNGISDLARLYLLMGEKLEGEGRRAEALLALQTASLLNPHCVDTHKRLASIFERSGEYERALRCYEKALLASPSDGEAFSLMSRCYERMGAQEAALLCRRKAEELALSYH